MELTHSLNHPCCLLWYETDNGICRQSLLLEERDWLLGVEQSHWDYQGRRSLRDSES